MSQEFELKPTVDEISDEALTRHAEAYILAGGGNFDMQVCFGPKGGGSRWIPGKGYVFDSKIKDYPDKRATWGVIDHEMNHENQSDLESVKDKWQELGFSFGYNAAEDPRANQGGIRMLPGTRDEIQAYIELDLGPGGGLDYKSIRKDTEGKLGYVPLHMQVGCEIIRYWYEREFAGKIADPQKAKTQFAKDFERFLDEIPKDKKHITKEEQAMIDFMKSIQPHFETFYHTTSPTKAEKSKYAAEAGENFKKNIWPAYSKLVEQSFKDQSMVDWLRDQLKQKTQQGQQGQQGQGMPMPGAGGGQPMVIPFDALPEDIKQEIREKIKEHAEQKKREKAQQKAGGQPQAGGQPGGGGEEEKDQAKQPVGGGGGAGEEKEEKEGAGTGGGEKPEDEKKGKGGGTEGEDKEAGEEKGGAGKEGKERKEGEEGEEGEDQVPWDKLSDKAKKEIEKVFDGKNDQGPKVTDEERKKHEEKAKEALEDAEDDANDKLQGKMAGEKPETHKEKRERETKEKVQQQGKDAQRIFEEMERRQSKAISPLTENAFSEVKSKPHVQKWITYLKQKLVPLFRPNQDPRVMYDDVGDELDIARAMEHRADPRITAIWRTEGGFLHKRRRATLLIDITPSTYVQLPVDEDDKLMKEFEVAVAFSEVFDLIGLENEIIAFAGGLSPGKKGNERDIIVYKAHDERLTGDVKKRIGKMLTDCGRGSGTPTKEATIAAWERIQARNRKMPMDFNHLITLTDGDCNTCSHEEMIDTVRTLQLKDRKTHISGFGIGPDTDFVNKTYPRLPERTKQRIAQLLGVNAARIDNAYSNPDDFVKAFVIIIEDMLRFPNEFKKSI